MHDTAEAIGAAFIQAYSSPGCRRILDVGSQDVNGSLRKYKPDEAEWIGVDLVAESGVDVVLHDPWSYPFPEASFDIVVSTSTFEHDTFFWLTILEIARVLKPGGFLYVNTPSNGPFHTYPVDCWRFYPDSGLALEAWTQRAGQSLVLIESFISRRKTDIWNDCVLVFGKPPATRKTPSLAEHFPGAMNIRYGRDEQICNRMVETEDFKLIRGLRKGIADMRAIAENLMNPQGGIAVLPVSATPVFSTPVNNSIAEERLAKTEATKMTQAAAVEDELGLADWKTINATLSPHQATSVRLPGSGPLQSFTLTETEMDGYHWCHWSTTFREHSVMEGRFIIRNRDASGLRVRLAIGDGVENVWLTFPEVESCPSLSNIFEVIQLEPELIYVKFMLEPKLTDVDIAVGLMLLDESKSVSYAGRRRSVKIEGFRINQRRVTSAAPSTVVVEEHASTHSRYSPFGRTAFELCKGIGLEIGALHKPFDLEANVVYLDRDRTSDLRSIYRNDARVSKIRQVQIVCNSSKYPFFDDNAFDFVINSHVLEHVSNPGRQIQEWLRIIRSGGVLYMVVPNKDYCFDRRRDVTPMEHLIEEYDSDIQTTTIDHYRDFIIGTEGEDGTHRDTSDDFIQRCFQQQSSIHVHTFTSESLKAFLTEMQDYLKFDLVFYDSQQLNLHCALQKR